jgi:hypothetical protein
VTAPSRRLEAVQRAFADRVLLTGGSDPGDAAIAVPPRRLDIYRENVRGGYRSMLRFGLTQTMKLVDRELAAARGAGGLPADADAVIVRFLQVAPSRTPSPREIADRFTAFLPHEYPALVARRPDLADLMALERAELRAMLDPDDPGRAMEPPELDALARGTLEDLLALRIVRAPSASLLRSAHPVVAVRAALERDEEPPPATAVAERAAVSRGRPPRFDVEFRVLTQDEALVHECARPGVATTAEDLAAAWASSLTGPLASADDARKAGAFAAAVVAGLGSAWFRAAD